LVDVRERIEGKLSPEVFRYIQLIGATVKAISKAVENEPGEEMIPFLDETVNLADELMQLYKENSLAGDATISFKEKAEVLYLNLTEKFLLPAMLFGVNSLQRTIDNNHQELLRCFDDQAASLSTVAAAVDDTREQIEFATTRAKLLKDHAVEGNLLEDFFSDLHKFTDVVKIKANDFILSQMGVEDGQTASFALDTILEHYQHSGIGPCPHLTEGVQCKCMKYSGEGETCEGCGHDHLHRK
jgi:hypothetical protein